MIFRGEGERKGDKIAKSWANMNFQWDFSISLLKAFWKTHSDQFATITDTSSGCESPVRVLKTATVPRNTLKTTLCSMNLYTSRRSPKGASKESRCLCLVHLLHSLIPRRKERGDCICPFCCLLSSLHPFVHSTLTRQESHFSAFTSLWYFTLRMQSPFLLWVFI